MGITSCMEGLEWIRTWRRNVTRASELGITRPDAMVLMGALHKPHEWLSMNSPQIAYRLSMVRQQLGVDRQPVFGMVWTFSEHLQAEAEQLLVDAQEFPKQSAAETSGQGSSASYGENTKSTKSTKEYWRWGYRW